jgi:hypothetical protein
VRSLCQCPYWLLLREQFVGLLLVVVVLLLQVVVLRRYQTERAAFCHSIK